MRIRRMELKAFGPFTDRRLELNSEAPGLHIIYGPNEAGKSSALRALKALLYGFPERTRDNFVHPNNQLLVGGCLENSDGRSISFWRRKKRKADIIDENGNPLDESVLAPFLHGVEPDIFETLYGIDHDSLVRGGQDILEQKGEVGRALFAAGAGLTTLKKVTESLEQEASDLFKPAGKLPLVNSSVRRYRQLQKELKDASLSSKKWEEHRRALKLAEKERDELETLRVEKSREMHRLERLQRAIPELGSLENLKNQLTKHKDVVLLPPDFSEQYRQVRQEIHEARLQLEKDTDRLRRLEAKRSAVLLNKVLLDHAEIIDDFHQRLGEYRKGQKDRPVRDGMHITLRTEAAALLKQLRPDMSIDEAETLRFVLARKRSVQSLAAKHESIKKQLEQAGRQRKDAARALEQANKKLAGMPEIADNSVLWQAIKPARQAGGIDAQVETQRNEIEKHTKDCLDELRRIGLYSGDLEGLTALCLPLPDTVKRFENQYDAIREKQKELEKEEKAVLKNLNNTEAEIKKLEYAGEVPTEQDLVSAREKREQGWRLLRRQWVDKRDVAAQSVDYDPERELPDAYERQVEQADHVADRLRREAERVTTAAALRAREESLKEELAQCGQRSKELGRNEEAFNKDWHGLWEPLAIRQLSPAEMRGWLGEMDKLRYKAADILRKKQETGRLEKQRDDLYRGIFEALKAAGEHDIFQSGFLDSILAFAENVAARIDEQKKELEKYREDREKTKQALTREADNLEKAQEAMTAWQKEWDHALSGLGIAGEVSPDEALDMLDILKNCFDKLKEAEDLEKRINGIDRDATELEKDVRGIIQKTAPAMQEQALSVDQAILQLKHMLGRAQKDRALFDELTDQIDSLKTDVSQVEKTIQAAKKRQNELFAIAGCKTQEELAAAISRFEEYQRIKQKVSETEANLAGTGEGVPIEELYRQARNIDADELPGRVEALQDEIENRIHPEISRASQVVGEHGAILGAMDGGSGAAEAAEKMEQEAAAIRRMAKRYIRVKLASGVLQKEIERYREQHQEPVLKIASTYFADLTIGSFAGLRTDVDDEGKPVLVGIRPDDSRLTVDGMSHGTRDQLYLALRLATLEWRLETSEPMPFIVDDILVNFDDDRTRATLRALAGLSDKTQVIVFTHHRQVAEAAETMGTPVNL